MEEEVVTINTNTFNEPQIDIMSLPDVVVKFTFKDKTYIATEFDMQFSQQVNHHNLPIGEVCGGTITITLSGQLDENVTAWMMTVNEKQNGTIHFFNNKGKITENALLVILFNNAYCVRYHTVLDPLGSGMLTTLVISAHTLTMGNVEYKNRWK